MKDWETRKKIKVALVVLTIAVVVLVSVIVLAQRRRTVSLSSRRAGAGPTQIILAASGDLQEAMNSAQFGDTIVLQAGATYSGPVILSNKGTGKGTDADYITIRTSDLSAISTDGERIDPAVHARGMPKIVSPSQQSAITAEPQAHHFKFIGVEFAPAAQATYVYNLIDLGQSDYTDYSQFPHHLTFDRCYVHSTGFNRARRGFALNSAETSITNSYVSGFAGDGDETQAVAGWNGPGPFHIINNYLEGGAEILLFGGADPSIPNLVPADIEIRRNHFFRPDTWVGRATIKGNFELKNARRVVVDGNLFDSNIRQTAFVLTVRNQDGKAPWSIIEDIEITNNVVRHASTGINILGNDSYHPSQRANRIRIANNFFLDLVSPGDIAYFLQINGAESVVVEHNTVQQAGNILSAYDQPTKNFVFRNNIVQYNLYGMACFIQGPPCAQVSVCHCFPDAAIQGNVIADNANISANYPIDVNFPPGNFIVASYEKLGFADYVHEDFRLAPSSKYRAKATDGKDPGVDFRAFDMSGVKLAAKGSGSGSASGSPS